MVFEAAKCPSCGADIQVPSGMEMAKCMFCGSTLYVKDAIQKYKINISGEVTFNANIDSMVKSGHGFISLCKWPEAEKIFNNVIELNSTDYRGWWGLFLVKTENMKKINEYMHPTDISDATTAVKLAPPEIINQLQEVLEKYKTINPPFCRVTIYREKQYMGATSAYYISINRSEPLTIRFGQTLSVDLPIGNHRIECRFEYGKPVEYNIQINSESDYNVHLSWSNKVILEKI